MEECGRNVSGQQILARVSCYTCPSRFLGDKGCMSNSSAVSRWRQDCCFDRGHLLNTGAVSPASSYIILGPSLEPSYPSFPKCEPRTSCSESQMRAEDVHYRSTFWARLRPTELAFLRVGPGICLFSQLPRRLLRHRGNRRTDSRGSCLVRPVLSAQSTEPGTAKPSAASALKLKPQT